MLCVLYETRRVPLDEFVSAQRQTQEFEPHVFVHHLMNDSLLLEYSKLKATFDATISAADPRLLLLLKSFPCELFQMSEMCDTYILIFTYMNKLHTNRIAGKRLSVMHMSAHTLLRFGKPARLMDRSKNEYHFVFNKHCMRINTFINSRTLSLSS